jgi:hypothetical protein
MHDPDHYHYRYAADFLVGIYSDIERGFLPAESLDFSRKCQTFPTNYKCSNLHMFTIPINKLSWKVNAFDKNKYNTLFNEQKQ